MKNSKKKKLQQQQKSIPQKKRLSQVFLKDSWPCEMIADILIKDGVTSVLEIGPGSGALTKELLDRGISVFAVEKDERFALFLKEELVPSYEDKEGKLTVLNQDILEFDLKKHLEENPDITAVCGNIPYSISTHIVFHILPCLHLLKRSILLVQLEFAQRLASPPGKKSYGSLSVYTQLRSNTTLEFTVGKECFKPIPKVDSAVISFLEKKPAYSEVLLKKIEKITKAVFSQRRKKLSNSLKPFLSTMETNLSVELTRRCDTLSTEEFVTLAKELYPDL